MNPFTLSARASHDRKRVILRSRFETLSSTTAKASVADVSLMFHDSLQHANDAVTESGWAEASLAGKFNSGVLAMTSAIAINTHPSLARAIGARQKNPLFLGTCVRRLQPRIESWPGRAQVNPHRVRHGRSRELHAIDHCGCRRSLSRVACKCVDAKVATHRPGPVHDNGVLIP